MFNVDNDVLYEEAVQDLGAVYRLLRHAYTTAEEQGERDGWLSPWSSLSMGAFTESNVVRELLPDGVDLEGPVPVQDDFVELVRAAGLLMCKVRPAPQMPGLTDAVISVLGFVREVTR